MYSYPQPTTDQERTETQSLAPPQWSEINDFINQPMDHTSSYGMRPTTDPYQLHAETRVPPPPSTVLVDNNIGNQVPASTQPYPNYTMTVSPPSEMQPYQPPYTNDQPRIYRGVPVKHKDAHLPDDILAYKERRKTGTVVATWVGGTVGLLTLGPLGAVGVAGATYGVTKSLGKVRERQLIRQHESTTLPSPHAASQDLPEGHFA